MHAKSLYLLGFMSLATAALQGHSIGPLIRTLAGTAIRVGASASGGRRY